MSEDKKTVYLTLHKNFCRTDIKYTNPSSGEEKTFNSVTLPKGTTIDGKDVSYYQFCPLYVNPSKYKGDAFCDIPLLAEKQIWLQKSILDEEGKPTVAEDGRAVKDTVKVMPAQIKEALAQQRREYLASKKDPDLSERAQGAREGAKALSKGDVPLAEKSR